MYIPRTNVYLYHQADADEITVAITTGPVDDEDDTYMCNIDGMLQWHAQITYSAADAEAIDTTPAVMAAQANDHVAYEFNSFKTALAGNINEVSLLLPSYQAVFIVMILTDLIDFPLARAPPPNLKNERPAAALD